MGNASSANDYDEHDPFDGIDTIGYRVLGVQPDSPAAAAGLVSFLDFIVGAADQMLLGSGEDLEPGEAYNDVDFAGLLQEYKDKEIELLVWNIKNQKARLVTLTPADSWGGAGLLGVTIRLDNYAAAQERLVKVLEVEDGGPAAVAGLVAGADYILGTTQDTVDSVESLSTVLQSYVDTVVELYVYNIDSDLVRVVALYPTREWNGQGILGAAVGTGYLHQLPAASCATQGASVQRKVRYVRAKPQDDEKPKLMEQVVENEPALEMEPSDGEDENVEEVYNQELEERKEPPTFDPKSPPVVSPTTSKKSVSGSLLPPPPKMHFMSPS